jgi:hypothetical protein
MLAVWILLAMILGVLLGYYVPSVPQAFAAVSIDNVSLPVAVGLWGMMWPVLAKVTNYLHEEPLPFSIMFGSPFHGNLSRRTYLSM